MSLPTTKRSTVLPCRKTLCASTAIYVEPMTTRPAATAPNVSPSGSISQPRSLVYGRLCTMQYECCIVHVVRTLRTRYTAFAAGQRQVRESASCAGEVYNPVEVTTLINNKKRSGLTVRALVVNTYGVSCSAPLTGRPADLSRKTRTISLMPWECCYLFFLLRSAV